MMRFQRLGSLFQVRRVDLASKHGADTSPLIPTDRLYFTWLPAVPTQTDRVHFFAVDDKLVYAPFFSDFGPNSLAHVSRFCEMVKEKLNVGLFELFGPRLLLLIPFSVVWLLRNLPLRTGRSVWSAGWMATRRQTQLFSWLATW
jgi:hypothetical protein